MYDYLIVGSGLYGAVFAHEMKKRGKRCLVIDKRPHIGGNVYGKEEEGIFVHQYGAHIFHTSDQEVWEYMNQFAEFNSYRNEPIAMYQGQVYHLPFNMNTFEKMWGVVTPQEAKEKIQQQIQQYAVKEPKNLEEQALSLVGKDIYETLIKGYTEKQWGRSCKQLPAFIIQRLPLRFTYDNNYFQDRYQGIPICGYSKIIEQLLQGIEVQLQMPYHKFKKQFGEVSNKIIYTGMIDEYFEYCFGKLEYRSLRFVHEKYETENYQGNAVVNYTEKSVPYTRSIEHKHFVFGKQPITIVSKEYPLEWKDGEEPYYPINNEANNNRYRQYKELADQQDHIIFGGRLGSYRYYDMDQVVKEALNQVRREIKGEKR